ncbi:MAG: hypothetical protein PHV23_01230 [Candidatus Gracilibacteria bacterium]|nr:hypothetical protein [Candidatus Gracilibacteria bacterium]
MKQKFSKDEYKKFKKYFSMKKSESDIEKYFIDRTYKFIGYIKWIPGLKMVGVGNSISMNSASLESDIDLYIVTSPNTMWLNRLLITIIFQILGVRKAGKKHAGMFCLSFFSTTKGMDFSDWAIEKDIYLYFWVLHLKPLLNIDNTYESFLKKNTSWLNLDGYEDIIKSNKKYIRFYKNTSSDDSIENILKKIDSFIKKIFLPRTLKHFKEIGKPYGVIINDNLLKFHDNDIRKKTKKEILD